MSEGPRKLTLAEMKLRSQVRFEEEKEAARLKRDMLVLVLDYLMQNGYVESLQRLQSESGVSLQKWQAADNIDLKVVTQEFEAYFKLKYNRPAKLVRKATADEESAGGMTKPATYSSITPASNNNNSSNTNSNTNASSSNKPPRAPAAENTSSNARFGRRAASAAPTSSSSSASAAAAAAAAEAAAAAAGPLGLGIGVGLTGSSVTSAASSSAHGHAAAPSAHASNNNSNNNSGLGYAAHAGGVNAQQLNSLHAGALSDQGFHAARGSSSSAGPSRSNSRIGGAVNNNSSNSGPGLAAGPGPGHYRGASGGSVMLDRPPAGAAHDGGGGAQNGGDDTEEFFEHRVLKPLPQYSGQLRELAEMISQDIYSENPNTHWGDIVGLEEAKSLVKEAVIMPMQFPELFTGILRPWKGILLYGPPGTGKTMLARAVATECRTTFFNISASSIVSKFRGDSEKLVRVLFDLARHYAPSTIFLDELDAIMGTRDATGEHEASRRMKTELLMQMDGIVKSSEPVFVLAASNHPWHLDAAMLRRLEKRILVPLPDAPARAALLQQSLTENDRAAPMDYGALAAKTEGYSGADIVLLCKEAAMRPVRRLMSRLHNVAESGCTRAEVDKVTAGDVTAALAATRPSASKKFLERYDKWDLDYGSGSSEVLHEPAEGED